MTKAVRAEWVVIPGGEQGPSLHRTPRPNGEEPQGRAAEPQRAPTYLPETEPRRPSAPTYLPEAEPRRPEKARRRDRRPTPAPPKPRGRVVTPPAPRDKPSSDAAPPKRKRRRSDAAKSDKARVAPPQRPPAEDRPSGPVRPADAKPRRARAEAAPAAKPAREARPPKLARDAKSSVLRTHMVDGNDLPSEIRAAREAARSNCEITVFFGCRGGVGCTTLATSVAAELCAAGSRVAILDLDLQFGSVLTALDLPAAYPLSEVLADADAIERDRNGAWVERLPMHESGAYVLSQVGHIDDVGEITHDAVRSLVALAQKHFDVLIVDGARDFSDHAMALLDKAHRVVMVGSQDVPSMRGLTMRLEVFRRLGWTDEDITLVLNRFQKKARVTLGAIEEALGIAPSFTVANDFEVAQKAVDMGAPLGVVAKRARITRDVREMTEELFGVSLGTKRGLFARGRK